MNTTARSTLSTSTALGLASFTITSAFTAGAAAPATLLGFGLLAVYGLIEIVIVSYETPRFVTLSTPVAVRAETARTVAPARRHIRVPALIEYPMAKNTVLARAA